MDKIKFNSNINFSFKLVEKNHKSKINNKRLTKLIKGICKKENDIYRISVNITELKPKYIDNKYPDILLLDFTEESYNLRGVIAVFERKPDNTGRYVRYIRNESQCKFFPGNPEVLVPFCNNWVCSGYIVKRDGKLMFDFKECIAPKGYNVIKIDDD